MALVGMERMPSSMVVADWLRRLAGVELRGTERGGWEEGLKKVRGTMGYYGFMDGICVMAELEPGNHSPNDHVAERTVWLCRLRRGAPLCSRAIVLRPRVWRKISRRNGFSPDLQFRGKFSILSRSSDDAHRPLTPARKLFRLAGLSPLTLYGGYYGRTTKEDDPPRPVQKSG